MDSFDEPCVDLFWLRITEGMLETIALDERISELKDGAKNVKIIIGDVPLMQHRSSNLTATSWGT